MSPRRKPRGKEERREQISSVARDVFARRGYHQTTIEDIVLQAGIARGTFYLYFEDKRDIELASTIISQRLNTSEAVIDNIGELNKQKYAIEAEQAFAQGGDSYKKRVQLSNSLLGFTGPDSVRFQQEKTAPPQLPSENQVGLGKYSIDGKIKNRYLLYFQS